jgi:hypothetical protein
MKIFLVALLSSICSVGFSQHNGTIKIQKEKDMRHAEVRFNGLENGAVSLRTYLTDKCLEPNLGAITQFEVIVEDEKGNWGWIKNDSACFSGENYQILEKLGSGSHLEFINIIGLNDQGVKIIYPGMKFVLVKKL